MKLTTLDVLIITAFTTQETITLPRTTFDTYSNFVKRSPIFSVHSTGTNVDIRVRDYTILRKKYSYWRRRYIQDRVVPFEPNGFGAVRLLEHARTFSNLSATRSGWWDLEIDTYYLNNQAQPRSGLCWAWDWFFAIQLFVRKHPYDWYKADLRLITSNSPHTAALFFAGLSPTTPDIPQLEQSLYTLFRAHVKHPYRYNGLEATSSSQNIKFHGHVINLPKSKSRARKFLVLVAQAQGNFVPLGKAYLAVY